VAVGEGGNTIANSVDGITWTGLGLPVFSTSGRGVAWNGTLWVAVGQGGNTIATSTNGITWTGRGTSIFSVSGQGITWNGTLWVATGNGTNTIATSPDGITWTGRASPFSSIGYDVAWNAGLGDVSGADIVLNKYGPSQTNSLDIVSDRYYNQGFNNFSVSINTY
jgi:hypothetical protein